MSKNDKEMTFLSHLAELRQRLLKSLIVLAISIGVCCIPPVTKGIINFLKAPAPEDSFSPIYTEMLGGVTVYFKVALISGVVLALPFLVYQLIMFVSPALTRREKKYVYIALPWVTLMFAAGFAFGYYVAMPPATKFLLTFMSDQATPMPTINDYLSLATRFLLALGLAFETPVVITFLARLGVVKPEWLASKRKWAIVVAFILAAIITPTFDPINQSIVACPIIILYEMSIQLSKIAYRKRAEAAESSDYLER
ncbi:MAG TPA: twin-arginine translocase subunit TatC [Dehalococcoidia bacterium]|nr:twin-arginine translocase subunit TatC [Dehalococcoidia bacterium]